MRLWNKNSGQDFVRRARHHSLDAPDVRETPDRADTADTADGTG